MQKKFLVFILTLLSILMLLGCGQSVNDKEIHLTSEKKSAIIKLPTTDLINGSTAIMGVDTNNNIISGEDFSVLNHKKLVQVGEKLKNNTIIQYQIVDGNYSKQSLSEFGTVKKIKNKENKTCNYVIVNDTQKYVAYVSIQNNKKCSVLLTIESLSKIDEYSLFNYINRVSFEK